MTGPVQYDPDELDRSANALARAREVLNTEARNIRTAVQSMNRFTGKEADRFRAQVEQEVRALTKQSETLNQQAQSLRRLAQDVRNLRLR